MSSSITDDFLIYTAFAGIANGFIKDGVTTWVPSILKENFGVPSSLSIIVTLLLPVLSIFGASLVKILHKRQKNENILNGIFYLAAVIFAGLIILFGIMIIVTCKDIFKLFG